MTAFATAKSHPELFPSQRAKVVILCLLSISVGCDQRETEKRRSLFGQNTVDKILPKISPRYIRELHITNASLSKNHWELIGEFRNLEELTLRHCKIDGQHLKTLVALDRLNKLVLQVHSTDISDSDMTFLASLNALETFGIGSQHVTDIGLAKLSHNSKLTSLRVSCPNATGSFLTSLSAKEKLRHVELYGCAIDDVNIKYIAEFRYLRSLWLGKTKVTDAGLMQVSNNLWLVNVTPSPLMTNSGLLKFREALLAARQQARERGVVVPPNDMLFINVQDPEIRGQPPAAGQSKILDELRQSIDK